MSAWRGYRRTLPVLLAITLGLSGCASLKGGQPWTGWGSAEEHGLTRETQAANTQAATTQADEPLPPALEALLERLRHWQDYGGELVQRLDPQQANWEVEAIPLARNRVELRLRMKRFHTGGAGEAGALFARQASDLVRYGGYEGYRTLEYGESIESLAGGARRVARGVVELWGGPAIQGAGSGATGSGVKLAPATDSSSPRAAKPRS